MILYDDIPYSDCCVKCQNFSKEKHPLYKYGIFNYKELEFLIRTYFSLISEKEYNTVFYGYTDRGFLSMITTPMLFMLIKPLYSMKEYDELNNQYFNNFYSKDATTIEENKEKIYSLCTNESKKGTSLLMMNRMQTICEDNLEIEIFNFNRKKIKKNQIPYDEYGIWNERYFYPSMRIFENCMYDIAFNINNEDIGLKNFLYSVAIYKKNNGIEKLSFDNMNQIFEQTFGIKDFAVDEKDMMPSLILKYNI